MHIIPENIKNSVLKRRIVDISIKHGLSHLGSCLTSVDIIDEIYSIKKPTEKFVLSSGHAGLALYCVIEKYEGIDAEKIYLHHGVHPDKCQECHLYCSTGSLGQGLPIAVGMALADRKTNIYCLISDGECSEGTIWESANIISKYKIDNLKVYLNFNGWGAYDPIDDTLIDKITIIMPDIKVIRTNYNDYPFLTGQSAHYITLK